MSSLLLSLQLVLGGVLAVDKVDDKVSRFHDSSVPEVREEVSRALAEISGELKVYASSGLEYRSSSVVVTFRDVTVSGSSATALVEVNAEWFWGFVGQHDNTQTSVFNIHELKLVNNGGSWRIVQNRNLASKNRPALKAPSGKTTVPSPQAGIIQPMATYTYDRVSAMIYAVDHWSSPNPSYDDYSIYDTGDCTNFTSQAIREGGGYPMQGGSPNKVGYWWYDFTIPGPNDNHSEPWAVANSQAAWMRSHYGAYVLGSNGQPINMATDSSRTNDTYLGTGDIMYFDFGTDQYFDHSAIITGWKYNTFTYVYEPLVSYRNSSGRAPKKDVYWKLAGANLIYGLHMNNSVTVP